MIELKNLFGYFVIHSQIDTKIHKIRNERAWNFANDNYVNKFYKLKLNYDEK